MSNDSIEQQARDLLARLDVPNAQGYSSGDLVELANLIANQYHPPVVSAIPSALDEMRRLFFKGLAHLRRNKIADFSQEAEVVNGKFVRFISSSTDNAWLGFRIAMQAARNLSMHELLPMDSAPLDGTEVILRVKSRAGIKGKYLVGHYMQGGHCIEDHPPIDAGWYFWNGRMFDAAAEPTGWMALPIGAPDNENTKGPQQ